MKNSLYTRGYTLLFAVFTAALVLGVAAFVVGIARKQYIISATSRDSAYSLYAADSGIQCVVQAGAGDWTPESLPSSISCAGNNAISFTFAQITTTSDLPDDIKNIFDTSDLQARPIMQAPPPSTPTSHIEFALREYNTPTITGCVRMQIWVGHDKQSPVSTRTVVQSRGYNVCTDAGVPATSPRTVERAMRLVK